MRHSTQEEKDDYEAMLKRKSTVLTTSEEFERFESENASLRGAAQGLGRLCDQYKAENSKLRELCRDMFTTISWCNLDCYPSDNKKREYVDRLRELGVEVPHECE